MFLLTQSSIIFSKSNLKFKVTFKQLNSISKYSRNSDKCNKKNLVSSGELIFLFCCFLPNFTYKKLFKLKMFRISNEN